MRYMGIDYGEKRVGVALSDAGGAMAFPHGIVPNNASLVASLTSIAEEEGVDEIVMGHSHALSGKENPIQTRAAMCARALSGRLDIPVHFESEVYSTQEARRGQEEAEHVDDSAAAIILNSYLNRIKNAS